VPFVEGPVINAQNARNRVGQATAGPEGSQPLKH
jgi:hypothetical protein